MGDPQRTGRGDSSIDPVVHRQLFNALVELALQIVFLLLQFLLFLPQPFQLVFALRDFGDVSLVGFLQNFKPA